MVLQLMEAFLDKGYHLFTDNWYNSLPLTKYMSLRRTCITRALRPDRKFIPIDAMKKKLKKGEMILKSLNDFSVIKWKGKRDVRMITNAVVPEIVESVKRSWNLKRNPMPFMFIIKHVWYWPIWPNGFLPFRVEKNC